MSNKYMGLSNEEVTQRVESNQVNKVPSEKTKSSFQIVLAHAFTWFNLTQFMIAFALFYVKAYLSLFFINTTIMNIGIQSYQTIRSKRMVEKLNLLINESSQVIRNGELISVSNDDLVTDDIIYFKTGDQIPSDSILLDENLEMNESMLTGESKAVNKKPGDEILSGSFVSSGHAYAKVIRVGVDNYAQKIMADVRKEKEVRSVLMDTFSRVADICGKIVVPIGAILLIQAYVIRENSLAVTVTTTATVLLGLLPKGLVLLASLSFAVSVFRLGRKRTLVQSIYSIETLSKVDILCIDKTGTLTEGVMSVDQVLYLEPESKVNDYIETYLSYSLDEDSTTNALKDHFKSVSHFEVKDKMGFSSSRKWGAMKFSENEFIFLGAPDFLIPNYDYPEAIIIAQKEGARILLVAKGETSFDSNDLKPLAFIAIKDPLRFDAKDTLTFFNENEVKVKIISGDHIQTLLAVAIQAGIQEGDKAIDVRDVQSDDELEHAVMNYNVIGRASPYQKQKMIKMLQKNDLKVCMVGDGVNDVLALRSADCSVAMGAGSSAARQISQMILLDNEFSTMVDVVMEGRLVTNNISRSASMYYLRTMMTFVLAMIAIVTNTAYPFIPIQLTVMSMFVEGMPSSLITFETSAVKQKRPILKEVGRYIIPVAMTMAVIYVIILNLSDPHEIKITMMYYATVFLSFMLVYKVFQPLNWQRVAVFALSTVLLVTLSIVFSSYLNISNFSFLRVQVTFLLTALSYVILEVFEYITHRVIK